MKNQIQATIQTQPKQRMHTVNVTINLLVKATDRKPAIGHALWLLSKALPTGIIIKKATATVVASERKSPRAK